MLDWQGKNVEPIEEVDVSHDGKGYCKIRFTSKGFEDIGKPTKLVIAENGNRLYMMADERGWIVRNSSKHRWEVSTGERFKSWDGAFRLRYDEKEKAFFVERNLENGKNV